MNELDTIARKLWFHEAHAVKLVSAMTNHDRLNIEQRLLARYGVSVNLFGSIDDIRTSIEIAQA